MLDIKAWINKITQTTIAGEIKAFAGTSVPAGWLACDGSAVSRTTYAALFAAIGRGCLAC